MPIDWELLRNGETIGCVIGTPKFADAVGKSRKPETVNRKTVRGTWFFVLSSLCAKLRLMSLNERPSTNYQEQSTKDKATDSGCSRFPVHGFRPFPVHGFRLYQSCPFLALNNISKKYDSTTAVKSVALEVERGEFFGLLGPSGCGKTTTLRMIAGLEKPDAGTIDFAGHDITNLTPEARGFGMVFQNYAALPSSECVREHSVRFAGPAETKIGNRRARSSRFGI